MNNFIAESKRIGQIIILEQHLPIDQKTFKPIEVGGIAGGEKFICHGIFFKFVYDHKEIYGGNEFGMLD